MKLFTALVLFLSPLISFGQNTQKIEMRVKITTPPKAPEQINYGDESAKIINSARSVEEQRDAARAGFLKKYQETKEKISGYSCTGNSAELNKLVIITQDLALQRADMEYRQLTAGLIEVSYHNSGMDDLFFAYKMSVDRVYMIQSSLEQKMKSLINNGSDSLAYALLDEIETFVKKFTAHISSTTLNVSKRRIAYSNRKVIFSIANIKYSPSEFYSKCSDIISKY